MKPLTKPIILGARGHTDPVVYETPDGVRIAAASDKGFGYKDGRINEDRVVLARRMTAVIDGMGGNPNGERAAQIIAEELAMDPMNVRKALGLAAERIKGEQIGDARACVQIVKWVPGGRSGLGVLAYQAGDVERDIIRCRTFFQWLFLRPHTTEHATVHTYEQQLIAEGKKPEEAARHPEAHTVTNSIGQARVDPEEMLLHLSAGDLMLLHSDGFAGNVPIGERIDLVTKLPLEEAIKEFWRLSDARARNYDRERAAGRPARRDNRSGVIIQVP